MNPIQKVEQLTKNEYYETHLSLVNCLLPIKLTPMEIKVLSRFMSLEGDVATYRFGATAKRIVKDDLNLSSAGLSNYMRTLTEKEFLIVRGEMIDILPILFPEKAHQIYMFKLININ